uniref:hypothetical protein n=1 Tax=uncultured Caulobacter sp. TaxID=158749 RepID=UPI0025DA808F
DRPTKWSELTAEGRAAKRGGIDWWSSLKLRPSGSADWWDNTCHRSLLSQHALAALSLAAQDRRRSVTFVSFACSGATMLDGFVAPRTSAPGGPRHKGGEWDSIAYRESQINQAVDLLCEVKGQEQKLAIPQGLTYWNQLSSHTLKKAGQGLKEVVVQTCSTWWRRPDVVLNTLGGNDIGFAGVAAWAVMPANGRTPGSVFFLANSELEKSRNPNMGLVCPLKVPGQWRCQTIASQWNPFTWDYAPSAEELALIDLPAMLDLGARAFNLSGLGAKAKVKIHTLYPSILRDEAGRLCGERWTKLPGVRTIPAKDEGLRMQREPWLAQYTRVPSFFQPDPWSFGIANAPDGKDCLYGVPDNIAYYSACVLEKRAWANLNRNVGEVMARSGWTVVDQAPVTARHGVCASDGLGQTYEKEFGWPRWIAGGWDRDYPAPTDWNAYAPRSGRWFRTANDAALTQYVVFKGKEGRGEAVSGTIHPTAQAHAVMADQIVRAAGDLHAPVHAD